MKRKISIVILMVLLIISVAGSVMLTAMAEQPEDGFRWHYDQLDSLSQKLYNAMKQMYDQNLFVTGNGSVDLVAEGYVTQQQLQDYMNKSGNLAELFQNARDAFASDYYQLFYIDFTKLTLRVGQLDGKLAAYINNGSNADYYATGYSSKTSVESDIKSVNEAIDSIIEDINAKLEATFGSLDVEFGNLKLNYSHEAIARFAHNSLIEKLDYTYPSSQYPKVASIASIIDGKANCVGYSTLFKLLMDSYSIPCITVGGMAENSLKKLESHMWNYVLIEEKWYAVDVTWDDPITDSRATDIRDTYLLRGSADFATDHFLSGIFSPGGMEFEYPELSEMDFGVSTLSETSSDIHIYASRYESDITSSIISFNYQGRPITKLADGLYVAGQFQYYGREPNPWVPMNAYDFTMSKDGYAMISYSKRGSLRLCITKIPCDTLTYEQDLAEDGNHEAISDSFVIPYYDDYMPAPFIHTSSPSLTRKIEAEPTEFDILYDDKLVIVDPTKPITATVHTTENVSGLVENITLSEEELKLPGQLPRTVTRVKFRFTPSNDYQCYINRYRVQLDNLTGIRSGKIPNAVPICVSFPMSIPCPSLVASGYVSNNAMVIALPTLVVNPNADIFEYDGTDQANALDIRLVATKPNQQQQDDLQELIPETEILSSAAYDLSLACNNYIARLKSDASYNLTIGVPYPQGYHYNSDPGVQFKAYHYIKLDNGEYEVVEVPCRIGERGLEILVDGFSPYMIVAVPKTEQDDQHKFVNLTIATHGGDVTTETSAKDGGYVTHSAAGLYSLQEGSRTFQIIPDEGYVVDKILINRRLVNSNGAIVFDYDTMQSDNELEVYFVAQTVRDTEAQGGFVHIIESIEREVSSILISSLPDKLQYKVGDNADMKGLVVELIFNDNTRKTLADNEYTVSGYEKLSSGKNTVTIKLTSITDLTATFDVEAESSATLTIVLILCGIVVVCGVVFVILRYKRPQLFQKKK